MKQNKWIVTSLLLLAGCLLPDRAAAQWKVGVSAGYAYNQYSIDTQYAYDFNFDGRGGVTVGIPVEYGILDWLAVRADFVYLQKGYSMQRAYDQGFRDRRYEFISKRDNRFDAGLVGGVGVCYRIHPHIELEAEGRCYYALTSTTKDYMKHTKQPQYNTTFTIQAGVKYCF